jgi:hypothetical protein
VNRGSIPTTDTSADRRAAEDPDPDGGQPAATRQLASRARRTVRGTTHGARPPVEGGAAVARQILARGTRLAPFARPALVNGAAGVIVGDPSRPFAVVGFTISGGRIVDIDLITDPDKLPRFSLSD